MNCVFENSKGSSGGAIFINNNVQEYDIAILDNEFIGNLADLGSSGRLLGNYDK